MGTIGRRAALISDDPFLTWAGSPYASETVPMEIAQGKWFLRAFADGKKLNAVMGLHRNRIALTRKRATFDVHN